MGKIKEKRLVLREMTEQDIKKIGVDRWVRKVWWQWVILGIVVVALMVLVLENVSIESGWGEAGVALGCYLLFAIPFARRVYKTGQQFWNEVKDKEQPIKL